MSQERTHKKPTEIPQSDAQLHSEVPQPIVPHGEYYFILGTHQIRPDLLEKARQVSLGKY